MYHNLPKQTLECFFENCINKEVILFGRKKGLDKDTLPFLKQNNIKIKSILDNNAEIWGDFEGIQTLSPLSLYSENPEKIVILITSGSGFCLEIYKYIMDIDEKFNIFFWNVLSDKKNSEISVNLFENYEKIKSVEALFADNTSKMIYRNIINRRIIGYDVFSDLMIKTDTQYLLPEMYKKMNPSEVIIDCGAYNGDSIKKFSRFFGDNLKKVYAVEASAENLKLLNKVTVPNVEIEVIPYGLSDKSGRCEFWEYENQTSDNCISKKSEDFKISRTIEIELRSIDEIIPEDADITLIKMDIEGEEYNSLIGAFKTIERCLPRLAISIYHSAEDYYRIPLLLFERFPEYKFALRHHTRHFFDTILYAWI
ncbi:MAG: FkbM family methyltransferase [Oscillospiraceae bacterium]|jgi:FkbM family methyltransferase|nr:FkbM family methyltransferase [Oscillospiraceae bacterium]